MKKYPTAVMKYRYPGTCADIKKHSFLIDGICPHCGKDFTTVYGNADNFDYSEYWMMACVRRGKSGNEHQMIYNYKNQKLKCKLFDMVMATPMDLVAERYKKEES